MEPFTIEADDVGVWGGPLDTVVDWDEPAREIGIVGGSICGCIVEIGTSGEATKILTQLKINIS